MVITKDVKLPTEEELTVQEVELGTPVLRAGAFHFGKYCESQNNEFMLCRSEYSDPRKCLTEGKEVTSCALDFFRKLKKTCYDEFTQYANCLDKSSSSFEFKHCRKTQAVYDRCVLENLGIERPEIGYYCRPKVHATNRPPPPSERPTVYADANPGLKEEEVTGEAKYGTRFLFLN